MRLNRSIHTMIVAASLTLLLLGAGCDGGSQGGCGGSTGVDIPDNNLRRCLTNALGIDQDATISESTLKTLTSLECPAVAPGESIWRIEGLQYCSNLTRLDLGIQMISNIDALSGLTNLLVLNLGENPLLRKIDALAGLTNLTRLGLGDDSIVDIDALAGLTNLKQLSLYGNRIVNIDALSGLTNLQQLALFGNQIVNIDALSGLTRLTYLEIASNAIADIAPLVENSNICENEFGTYANMISLEDNPLNAESCGIYIPELLTRGCQVNHSCDAQDD